MEVTKAEWETLANELDLEWIEAEEGAYVMPLDVMVEILPDGRVRVDLAVVVRLFKSL